MLAKKQDASQRLRDVLEIFKEKLGERKEEVT